MLPGGTDEMYRAALAAPHRPWTQIVIFDGNGNPVTTLTYGKRNHFSSADQSVIFYGGTVTATLTSRVARNLQFSCHEDLYPVLETDPLNPYGPIVRVYAGIELGDGSRAYTWQVFGGRVQRTTWDSNSGTNSVECSDFAADVIENGFLRPVNSSVGILCVDQIKELILGGYPNAKFGAFDSFSARMPQLTWESDRGQALDEISKSLSAFWYSLATEEFVTRIIPWTQAGSPVVNLRGGPGGHILSARASRSRADVANAIGVTGERSDGTLPVYATSLDVNPESPTYINGPFGRRTRQAHLQTPVSQGQVQSLANDLLQSSKARTESWDLTIIPDASLELGDVLGIEVGNRTGVVQVVSSYVLPLDLAGGMTVSARAQIPALLGEEDDA
jgi:hypothetical protein